MKAIYSDVAQAVARVILVTGGGGDMAEKKKRTDLSARMKHVCRPDRRVLVDL